MRHVQNAHALKIALVSDAEIVGYDLGGVITEDADNLLGSPDEELAFHTLAVGVLGRVESAVRVAHLAQDVVQNALGDFCVGRVARGLVSVCVQPGEKRVVVEHLLEVGNQPECVCGVPVKASANLVVHASGGHLVEGQFEHLERERHTSPMIEAEKEFESLRLGELWLKTEAAGSVVELVSQLIERGSQNGISERFDTSARGETLVNPVNELSSTGQHIGAAVPEDIRHCFQDTGKRGQTAPVLGREVGAAVERRAVRSEEDGHGPSAVSCHRLDSSHVNGIHVRALFAVHLNADERLVHHGGDLGILERLALHNVAPVAGGVADAEKDGQVSLAGGLKRLLAPGIPVNGVVFVLEQVKACFFGQAVWHCAASVSADLEGRDLFGSEVGDADGVVVGVGDV